MLSWLSLSWRARINIEALNMAESVGYYTKHRRAPIAIYDEEERKYVLRYVPVISGECLGHGYQLWLAYEAKREGLNVCSLCERGELVKHGARITLVDEKLVTKGPEEIDSPERAQRLEEQLIRGCVVEDVSGFLVPTRVPVKRTSRFYVGYMLPAIEDISVTTLEPQFHVRHAPSLVGRETEMPESGQAIYYVETGTGIFTASFSLDIDGIGYTSMYEIKPVVDKEERVKRVLCAVKAIYPIILGKFGAKRTRFDPDYEILSAVASIGKGLPFNVTPGHYRNYILKTVKRVRKTKDLGGDFKVLAYIAERDVEISKDVETTNTVEDFITRLILEVENLLKK